MAPRALLMTTCWPSVRLRASASTGFISSVGCFGNGCPGNRDLFLDRLATPHSRQHRQQAADRDWQKQKAGDLVSPLQKGKSGSWRELFTERDKAVFREVAGEVLVTWKYEETVGW